MTFIWGISLVLITIFIILIIDLLLIQQNRSLKFEREKLIAQAEFNDEIQRTKLEVSNDILVKIGQELHDNWGQILTFTSFMLSQEKMSLKESQELMSEARSNISQVVNGIRDLSHSFKSINGNLFGHLHQLKLLNDKIGAFELQLVLNGPLSMVNQETQVILVRITQELLNNSLRHGKASLSTLEIEIGESNLMYKYTDNGQGFDINSKLFKPGIGISNIHTRINLLNGKVEIDTAPGKGFRLESVIPL